ncbi:MAG: ketoacyl-ACP synthase III [Planctomycetaceae bacterium]|nr:ketoacyl-ACP synthase III [Planctomycetaceae bacterium]
MASRVDNQENRSGDTASSDQPTTPSSAQRRSSAERPNPHDSIQSLTGVEVIATGACAPSEIVRNEDLAQLGYDADWIVQRTGIRERRRAPADQATSDVALAAARHCLQQAQLEAEDLDFILVATMTPDHMTPSTACVVQQGLGAHCPALDLNAACAGFMYGLITGMHFIHSGTYQRVMVIGADLLSRIVDPKDKKTYPLFGDGAGAVLLGGNDNNPGLLAFTLGADGSGGESLWVPGGGSREPLTESTMTAGRQYLQMDGRAVFKWAVRTITESVTAVMQHAGIEKKDLSLVVFHQANMRIIDAATDHLGLDPDQVFVNLDRYGNTSAASIPLALEEACQQGRVQRGDKVLLSGFGAGLAWGSAILQW